MDPIIIVAICGGLCLVGLVLAFLMSLLDIVFGIIGAIVGVFTGLLSLGPLPGCGCVILVGLIGFCGMMSYWLVDTLGKCGTADAVNLCRLF